MLALSLFHLAATGNYSYCQVPDSPADTLSNRDSLIIVSDTTLTNDTIRTGSSDIDTTIIYSAEDSIRMDVVNKLVYLYGNSKITYGGISLTAAEVAINWGTNLVVARPAYDSSGKKIGVPVFNDEGDVYVIEDSILYNFQTKKGIIYGAATKQGEGFILTERVKKVGDDLYISDAKYTTCNLSHPHFYIHANKMKVIPRDKIVSGPFNLVIADVPTPVGFVLGFFPVPKAKKSGFIIPTFGSSDKGFFLREGGYYWAVNDYLGLRAFGDVYANSSYRANLEANYTSRYRFYGNVFVSTSRTKFGFDEDEDPLTDFNFRWSHGTRARKNSNLTANVNAASSRYYRRNSYNPTAFQTGVLSSTVLYYKNFANTPFNVNVALRQDQNVNTRVMNFTLPEVTLGMNRVYPFKGSGLGKNAILGNFNFAYTGNTRVFITNDSTRNGLERTLDFTKENLPELLSKAEYGARHTIPVSTTFKFKKTFLRFFNISPNATYEEFWYPQRLDYTWDASAKALDVDTINKFSRTYTYGGSIMVSTNIYGTYKFKSKKLLGIRHTIVPQVGYAFRPDFSKMNNNFVKVQTDTLGTEQVLSRYQGFMYGGPSIGAIGGITFSINNSIEAKTTSKKDTVTGIKKFKLIDQWLISGGYNFLAERNKLSVIQTSANTRILNRVDILTSATFDPYLYDDSTNQRTDLFAIEEGEGLARLTNYNVSIGVSLNKNASPVLRRRDVPGTTPFDANYMDPMLLQYVDFNVPWSLFVRYNINYTKIGNTVPSVTQTLSFNGSVNLTEKWKVEMSSGYDFERSEMAFTQFSVHRDLHCWQMAFSVIPFGLARSYTFSINAKASILQDLKLNKRSSSFYGYY